MTSTGDPHRLFLLRSLLLAGVCWTGALLAAFWAWRVTPPAGPVLPGPVLSKTTAGKSITAIDPAAWQVELWRGAHEQAAPADAGAGPGTPKLFSILTLGDRLIAAIDPGTGTGLVYLHLGESANGITAVNVESEACVVRVNGRDLRLGLAP